MPHRFDPSPRQVDVLCRRYMAPWPYSPGMGGDGRAEIGEDWRLELSLTSGDALEKFGSVLSRAYDMCKAQGKDY